MPLLRLGPSSHQQAMIDAGHRDSQAAGAIVNIKIKLIVAAVLLLLGGLPTALFAIQNAGRVTGLSLNTGLFAFELAEPMAVPALMGITFAAGLLAGVIVTLVVRNRIRAAPLPIGGTQSDPWT